MSFQCLGDHKSVMLEVSDVRLHLLQLMSSITGRDALFSLEPATGTSTWQSALSCRLQSFVYTIRHLVDPGRCLVAGRALEGTTYKNDLFTQSERHASLKKTGTFSANSTAAEHLVGESLQFSRWVPSTRSPPMQIASITSTAHAACCTPPD